MVREREGMRTIPKARDSLTVWKRRMRFPSLDRLVPAKGRPFDSQSASSVGKMESAGKKAQWTNA